MTKRGGGGGQKSPFDERAGWKCLTLELCLRRVDFLLEFEDGRLGKPCVAGHHFDGKSVQKEVLCYFLRLFPGRTVFPVRLVDVFHHVAEHISGTKITQFYFVLQYPEYGIGCEFAEIGLAVERVDGTEPLRDTATITCELCRVLQELVHFDKGHGLPIKIHTLFLVA